MLLLGCQGIIEPHLLEACVENASYSNILEDIEPLFSENAILIQSIIANEPLKLDDVELSYYANRFVWWGDSHGFIRDAWEDPSEINIEQLLYGYELTVFNFEYVLQFAENNPNMNLWPINEVVELVVNQEEVESFITQHVDVGIELLRESYIYEKELQGYRFRVMDGLGFRSALDANTVWRSAPFVVIEVGVEFEDTVRYLLIEIIDEYQFMYRAYIQLP